MSDVTQILSAIEQGHPSPAERRDYFAKTGTLTFDPGKTTKTITIEVKGDSK